MNSIISAFNPLSAVFDIGSKLIDHFFPNPADAANAKLKLLELQQSGELAQLTASTDLAKAQAAIDQVEAANTSLFVAGWRPAVGWTCALAFAYSFIVQPFTGLICTIIGHPVVLPPINISDMMPVLLGMLGLGAMRTVEKVQGINAGQ